jgi:glycine/D-amino acid oxidase-like deaminating enzyme
MSIDFLIVGQGLAGSLLAWELLQRQYRVSVIDNGAENASQVAAGLINPISGQRLVKSQDVEVLLASAQQLYRTLGAYFGQTFLVEQSMLRIMRNAKEFAQAQQRLLQPDYQAYLHPCATLPSGIQADFGVFQQSATGYLRTQPLLSSIKHYLQAQGCYRHERLAYANISLGKRVRYADITARHIIFCEGYQAQANPWFGQLPFQLAKGEILSLELQCPVPKHLLNYGHWLLPLAGQQVKTGASFDFQQLDHLPTLAAKNALIDNMQHVYPASKQAWRLLEQRVGIRPATLDKQPFIGAHPQFSNLHIFNGFGAKGSLTIPWYAQQLVQNLTQSTPLVYPYHVCRYYATHFPS